MLKVEDLVVSYGGIEALKKVSLEVEEGKIVTLIGANGAGKSTLIKLIGGVEMPTSGKITHSMTLSWPLGLAVGSKEV